jgi:hypothetical protein
MTRTPLYNHRWICRKVEIEREFVRHRHCVACGRDFVWDADREGWRAVHVSLLRFDFLDEEISRRWLAEECPGRRLPEEINDRRMMIKAVGNI